MLSELWCKHDPVLPEVDDGSNLALERLGRDPARERVIDRREVVEDEAESALELLSELPRHGQRRGRVVQNVTDEMQPGELAGHWRAIDDERGNDDIGDLERVLT